MVEKITELYAKVDSFVLPLVLKGGLLMFLIILSKNSCLISTRVTLQPPLKNLG